MTYNKPTASKKLRRLELRRIAGTFALAAAAMGVSACDGMSAGDYSVYRVSLEAAEYGDSCFSETGSALASIAEDSTNLRNGATFIFYLSEGDVPMLDTGSLVLEGEDRGADTFKFKGEIVDVEVPAGSVIYDSDHDGLDDYENDTFVDADADGIDDQIDEMVDVDGDFLDDRFEDDIVDMNNDGEDDRIVELPASYKFVTTTKIDVDLLVDGDIVTGSYDTTVTSACKGTLCPENFGSKCKVSRDYQGIEIDEANIDMGSDASMNP
jgi:hypothetical protein